MNKKQLIRTLDLYLTLCELERNWKNDRLTDLEARKGPPYSYSNKAQVTAHREMLERDLRGAIRVDGCRGLA